MKKIYFVFFFLFIVSCVGNKVNLERKNLLKSTVLVKNGMLIANWRSRSAITYLPVNRKLFEKRIKKYEGKIVIIKYRFVESVSPWEKRIKLILIRSEK